jgi:hypothetical protein
MAFPILCFAFFVDLKWQNNKNSSEIASRLGWKPKSISAMYEAWNKFHVSLSRWKSPPNFAERQKSLICGH